MTPSFPGGKRGRRKKARKKAFSSQRKKRHVFFFRPPLFFHINVEERGRRQKVRECTLFPSVRECTLFPSVRECTLFPSAEKKTVRFFIPEVNALLLPCGEKEGLFTSLLGALNSCDYIYLANPTNEKPPKRSTKKSIFGGVASSLFRKEVKRSNFFGRLRIQSFRGGDDTPAPPNKL